MSLLKPGDILRNETGAQECVVKSFLGGGGQGEVYSCVVDGRQAAVKWYFASWLKHDISLKQRLARAIDEGAPSDRFLWPEMLVTKQGVQGFGYVMPLRESRFRGLYDLVSGRTNPSTAALSTVGFELAHGFSLLHSNGMCYCDISFGNVFFDPSNGDIRICDNDNVDINSAGAKSVGGTPKFIAPEIVQLLSGPNIQTDQHSLSVLLFYMLHLHHPLEGKRCLRIRDDSTEKAQDVLYGSKAVFIFDPQNKENEAVDKNADPTGLSGHNAILNWSLYPPAVRDAFVKAFTAGLHDPYSRVTETEWKSAMMDMRDGIFPCTCGAEICFQGEGRDHFCYNCARQLPLPPRMTVSRASYRSVIVASAGKTLLPLHIDTQKASEITPSVGEIIERPNQPGVFGLKNTSQQTWSATAADGSQKSIDPGKVIPLSNGLRIHFGAAEAVVQI